MRFIQVIAAAVALLPFPAVAGECIIWTDENLTGDSYQVIDDEIGDLRNAKRGLAGTKDFNDEVSSIEVRSGTCTVYQHVNFGGLPKTLQVGRYNNAAEMGFMNDEISSVKAPK